jgi:putative SOS response-associated peptidase YedK
MCGRFSIFTPIQELKQRFDADIPDEPVFARYNAAPGQNMIVIPMDDPHKMHLFKWGLIPHWAKDEKIGYKMINARAETLKEKPAFRGSLQKGRCLVLADGFYEWSIKAGKKVPYRIELTNRKPFAMAGLCSQWKDEAGKEIDTFTIVTTQANKIVGTIHDRMPVILNKEWEREWLDPLRDAKDTDQFLMPYSENNMEMYPISTLVNSPKNDVAEILKPVYSSSP